MAENPQVTACRKVLIPMLTRLLNAPSEGEAMAVGVQLRNYVLEGEPKEAIYVFAHESWAMVESVLRVGESEFNIQEFSQLPHQTQVMISAVGATWGELFQKFPHDMSLIFVNVFDKSDQVTRKRLAWFSLPISKYLGRDVMELAREQLAPEQKEQAQRKRRRYRARWLMLVLVLAGGIWWSSRPCRWLDNILAHPSGCLRTFRVSGGGVGDVAFSPNGSILATGDYGDIKLWNVDSGQEVHTFTGHTTLITGLAFSSDGTTLASGDDDGVVKLWDVTDGRLLRTIKGHTGGWASVAFSPDGHTLASVSNEGQVKLWDVASGRELHTFSLQPSLRNGVEFLPDGRIVVAGSGHEVRLWDIASGQEIRAFSVQAGNLRCIAFSPNGEVVAVSGYGVGLSLVDMTSGQKARTFDGDIGSCAFSPSSEMLAWGTTVQEYWRIPRITVWDITSDREVRGFKGRGLGSTTVAFSPDGSMLASAYAYDETVFLWSMPN